MRSKRTIAVFVVLVGVVITACAVTEPAPDADRTVEAPAGTASVEAVEGTVLPEDEVSGEKIEVSWDEALEILNNGDVRIVSQEHSLQVSLVLNDGRTITTVEPKIDAIIDAIAACGEVCSEIILVSE